MSPTVHLGIVFVGSIACRPSGDDGGVRAIDAASATARVGDEPVTYVDQFALR